MEKQLRHLDFVEQAARHQLPQRETGLIEHGIAMARFGPVDIGDFVSESGRAVCARRGSWRSYINIKTVPRPADPGNCALRDRRRLFPRELDQPRRHRRDRTFVDPPIAATVWIEARRRNGHIAVASDVDAGAELRCATLDLNAVARVFQIVVD